MRFSLVDLVIWIVLELLGCAVVALGARFAGHGHLSGMTLQTLGVPLGVLFYLLFTPPIYRRFRLRPLFLPKCPHCKNRPFRYAVTENRWPRTVVVCGECGNMTELWRMPPASKDVSLTMPSLLLIWPQSVGRWRIIVGSGAVVEPDWNALNALRASRDLRAIEHGLPAIQAFALIFAFASALVAWNLFGPQAGTAERVSRIWVPFSPTLCRNLGLWPLMLFWPIMAVLTLCLLLLCQYRIRRLKSKLHDKAT